MAMESTLKNLEDRIEELVDAYSTARGHAAELEERVAALEEQLTASADAASRADELQSQKSALVKRLEGVLSVIDSALASADKSAD